MEKYSGKKLLILGGAYQHKKIVEKAKELGIKTYVTDYLDVEDSPAKKIADVKLMYNIFDIDEIVNYCKNEQIDGVIGPYLDPVQVPYYKICEKLNLPYFGNKNGYDILTDKTKFKNFCIENGADIISTYQLNDILEDKINIDYPVFVKPTDSRGSRGQSVCNNREELLNAVEFAKKESTAGTITIERYMKNASDVQLVYMVFDNEPVLVRIEDRYLGEDEDNLDKLCIATVCPTKHKNFREKINSQVCSMIRNMNLGTAPVFIQAFIEGDKALLYDPGLRFPGDDYDRSYKNVTGIDLSEMFIQFALTGNIENFKDKVKNAKINKSTAMVLPCVKPGVIKNILGIDLISKHPDVVTASYFYNQGDIVNKTGNVKQRFCEIVIQSDNIMSLKNTISYIFTTLKVIDENGEDMLISKFNTNTLNSYE